MRLMGLTVVLVLFCGCATIFNGYTAEIEIRNAPDSVQVITQDGIVLPAPSYGTKSVHEFVPGAQEYRTVERTDSSARSIRVRSNRDYILHFRTGTAELIYPAYAKVNLWWFALDCACGGLPAIVDAITGNWNYFDPIVFRK